MVPKEYCKYIRKMYKEGFANVVVRQYRQFRKTNESIEDYFLRYINSYLWFGKYKDFFSQKEKEEIQKAYLFLIKKYIKNNTTF